jgi:EF-P beta-lysylation protein EpmB
MSSVPDPFLANSDVDLTGSVSLPGDIKGSNANKSRSPDAGWQRELAQAIRSSEELLRRLDLDPGDPKTQQILLAAGIRLADQDTLRRFPVLVPENFLARMTPSDPYDPLLRQVLPLTEESLTVEGFISDPVGDFDSRRTAGVLQKYAGRVLLIATSACAVHCRYCFRRDYPYSEEPRRLEDWQPALDEIAADTSITEVIFSGGDPLMLNDSRLSILCSAIDQISHVERIRFHTRLPIVLPSRVTDELIYLMRELRTQPIMVVHANHGNELVGDCADVLRKVVRTGIPVLNQAVLLAGINDNVETMEALCRRLINLGVVPYYLHQLDRVSGTAHFEADRELGRQLIQNLATRLPGYAVPRFVQEIPGESSKTAL